MAKLTVTMTIDNDVLKSFRAYCAANGMKMSTRVEALMAELLRQQQPVK